MYTIKEINDAYNELGKQLDLVLAFFPNGERVSNKDGELFRRASQRIATIEEVTDFFVFEVYHKTINELLKENILKIQEDLERRGYITFFNQKEEDGFIVKDGFTMHPSLPIKINTGVDFPELWYLDRFTVYQQQDKLSVRK